MFQGSGLQHRFSWSRLFRDDGPDLAARSGPL